MMKEKWPKIGDAANCWLCEVWIMLPGEKERREFDAFVFPIGTHAGPVPKPVLVIDALE
jgi:hypothetical protein